MAAALKALFDKRQMALTKAKLRAWWEGVEFDEAAALEAMSAEPANDSDADLFEEPETPVPSRMKALSILWGANRLRPGDDAADGLTPARLGAPETGVVAVSGAGLSGPLLAFAEKFPGQIEAFEWREESIEVQRAGVRKAKLDGRITVTRIDLEAHVFKADHFDGLWSVDDFAYVGFPPHLAQQVFKMLKPGACAVVECYVGLKTPEFATAFASSFAEPQIRAHGDVLQSFADVGLVLEADEDVTDEFLGMARDSFKRLGESLSKADGLDVAAARELAWEAEAWRTRLKLLTHRRLERRRFILRKPGADAAASAETPVQAEPEKTNEPAA